MTINQTNPTQVRENSPRCSNLLDQAQGVINILGALSSSVVVFMGAFGHSFPEKSILATAVYLYASLAGLMFIGRRIPRPTAEMILVPGGFEPNRRNFSRRLTSNLKLARLPYLAAAPVYLVVIGTLFWLWIDREFRNRPPYIAQVRAQAYQLAPLHKTRIRVWAVDPDGERLHYSWITTYGTVEADRADGSQATFEAPASYGQQEITVTVADDKGKSADRSLVIDVRP